MLCIAPTTEAKKPGLRGEREASRKTIARGMPDRFGLPVVTTLVCFLFFAREAAGAKNTRYSLRPLCQGEGFLQKLGRDRRREKVEVRLA